MSDLYEAKRRTARVSHRCEYCGTKILPGTVYEWAKWLSDYGFTTLKLCIECHELSRDLYHEGVIGEDEYGNECYPYLPEVDWPDVRTIHPEFADRVDAYLRRRLDDPWSTPDKETDHA